VRFAASWCLWCVVCACASSPPRGPYFGDERWLVVGVAPAREADAVIAQMKAHGLALATRFDGVHHAALAFADAKGTTVSVRVVTAHGIVLARDAEPARPLRPGRSVRLLRSPLALGASGPNADEYVFVEERRGESAACVRIYLVRPGGELRPATKPVDPEGRALCQDADAHASDMVAPDASPLPAAPGEQAPPNGAESATAEPATATSASPLE
jgi:hypothetical protein